MGGPRWGVDVTNESLSDNLDACVWEPALVKKNAITAAAEAACLILSVDQTVKNPKVNSFFLFIVLLLTDRGKLQAQQSDGGDARAAMGMGGGMGMPM